jgi:hypothetical protein
MRQATSALAATSPTTSAQVEGPAGAGGCSQAAVPENEERGQPSHLERPGSWLDADEYLAHGQ